MLDIRGRLEVFWDDYLIDGDKTDAALRLHHPVRRECALLHDAPWEGDGCDYHNILWDGAQYRMYYLGWQMFNPEKTAHTTQDIRVCLAVSTDGLTWEKPELGICDFDGSKRNNIILDARTAAFDNFMVFLDDHPDCQAHRRFKGVAAYKNALWCFVSADGVHFTPGWQMTDQGKFDSLNTAHYDSLTGKYRCYLRDFHDVSDGDLNAGIRDIRVMESEDFIKWSEPKPIDFMGGEDIPLYTNAVSPYFRAPHILTGFPSRYVERKGWNLSFEQLCGKEARRQRIAVSPRYGLATTDCAFMTSRDGLCFHRFDEAFLRPGPERPLNWVYGDCYPALGLIQTKSDIPGAQDEMSLYVPENHWSGLPTHLMRHTLRLDGFASRGAPRQKKRIVTKPFVYSGSDLFINFSTSALGGMEIALYADGCPALYSGELFGDSPRRRVLFQEGFAASLSGRPVVMEIIMSDADIFSFIFE